MNKPIAAWRRSEEEGKDGTEEPHKRPNGSKRSAEGNPATIPGDGPDAPGSEPVAWVQGAGFPTKEIRPRVGEVDGFGRRTDLGAVRD